jgi:hypothetical protein
MATLTRYGWARSGWLPLTRKRSWLKMLAMGHRLFTRHPREAGESYGEHLRFTLMMTGRLLKCAIALPLHGLFPFLFVTTASDEMKRIQVILKSRAEALKYKNFSNHYEI